MSKQDRDKRIKALDNLPPRPKSKIELLAIERQKEDLLNGHKRDLVWDEKEAGYAVEFFRHLKHWKGEWAGKKFELQPWQEHCIIAPMFGWYLGEKRDRKTNKGGFRRFRKAGVEFPRKNGKTTLAAGIGLQALVADEESGAEVYAAATQREQARILFKDARNMLDGDMKSAIEFYQNSLTYEKQQSTFRPLASESNSLDGLNIHRAIVDELHAHKKRDLWDVLVTATGSRQHPMVMWISTAGHDRSSICWEEHEYVRKILEGTVVDDSYFGFVTTIDEGDDWSDPESWHKANPNLGISLKMEFLETESRKAIDSPAYENTFRRLHLNQWTEQSIRWIQMHVWDKCGGSVVAKELEGRKCYAGLDLASTRDVNSLVLVFPSGKGEYKMLPYYWIPLEAKDDRGGRDRTQVMNWAGQGLISQTPGNVTDYAYIRRDIINLREKYRIEEIAYDPWQATETATRLGEDRIEMVEFRQSMANFAEPTRAFERLLLCQKIEHGNDPVLRWMAGNVTTVEDPAGNIRPHKGQSSDKIDGIVAAIMGLARCMFYEDSTSVYTKRQPIVIN